MSWGFCPALPLTGDSDPRGMSGGFISANRILVVTSMSFNSHRLNRTVENKHRKN